MINALLTTALLPIKAKADFAADASAVSSAASVLSGSVSAWNGQLAGALGIQGYFPTLSNAVGSLSNDASSVKAADVDPATINAFGSAVAGLLSQLTTRASEFQSAGAGSIVGNDITSLSGPAAAIVSNLVNAVSADCDKVNQLTSVLTAIQGGFSSAASAYSIAQQSFATAPSCAASSSAPVEAATTSPAASVSSTASVTVSSGTTSVTSSKASSAAPSSTAPSSGNAGGDILSSALSILEKVAKALSDIINDFTGIFGAIEVGVFNAIFPGIESALNGLVDASSKFTGDNSIKTTIIKSFAGIVTSLLDALTAKADYLKSVNAYQKIANDISKIASPVVTIIENLVNKLDCAGIESVTESISTLETSFQAAASIFGIQVPNVPAPKCN